MSEFDFNWIKFVDDVNDTLNTFSTPTLTIDGDTPIEVDRSYGVQLKKASSSGQEFRMYYKTNDAFGLGNVEYVTLARVNSINDIRPNSYKYGFTERTPDWDSSQYNKYKI